LVPLETSVRRRSPSPSHPEDDADTRNSDDSPNSDAGRRRKKSRRGSFDKELIEALKTPTETESRIASAFEAFVKCYVENSQRQQ